MAAEKGATAAQARCGLTYATDDRSVLQNWTTAVKWWREAAEAGVKEAQWYIGQCYYYGRGVDRDATLNPGCRHAPMDSAVPHQSPRDSVWVDFLLANGLSDEELELAKHIYAYSKRTCTFICGSNSAPVHRVSLLHGTDCQHGDWNRPPRRSRTRFCAPASSCAAARGGRAGRD
jgi:hypothetical protein